jgi:hypothetical protein
MTAFHNALSHSRGKAVWSWSLLAEPERQAIEWINDCKANAGEWVRPTTFPPGFTRRSSRPFDLDLFALEVDGKGFSFAPGDRTGWCTSACQSSPGWV